MESIVFNDAGLRYRNVFLRISKNYFEQPTSIATMNVLYVLYLFFLTFYFSCLKSFAADLSFGENVHLKILL